jgi:hypothetical protein
MAEEDGNLENCPARKFLQILQEMEENHEHRRSFSGSMGYPGFFQAVYRGRVQIGFEDEKI